ncbi:UDP-N-acetylmuramoyl-tripeptide--D-alanyl-D-alanine ligase [Curvivirga sp.]|uniref:UDP-N-acetylmuramoyl-tripeptide--D-alanyl-D- alanine ligase n=1 Tax=Curvivirga sp. TaxID=2856848 RepID=UPI003B5CB937
MNIPLWTSSEAETFTSGKNTAQWEAHSVSIDSRKVEKNGLFIAIQGPNNDGHDYISMAQEKGAAAAVIAESKIGDFKDCTLPLLIVTDTTQALYDLAAGARFRTKAKVIAITGSVGKTGTKEGLRCAFSALGKTHATEGNLNNEYGLPLTMSRMPADTDFAILEIGMNHAEEIRPLSKLAKPDLAIITTVAPVHLEFFHGIQGIADAKAEIFDGLGEDGICLLPREHALFHHLRARARDTGVAFENVLSFGKHEDATYRQIDTEFKTTSTDVTCLYKKHCESFSIQMPGDHWATNSLCILGAVDILGEDVTKALNGLKNWKPSKGRGQRHIIPLEDNGTAILVDESYNASPPAMKAAFKVLADMPIKHGKRIAILGDMLELGETGSSLHIALAKELESRHIDAVYCCGPLMGEMYKALPTSMQRLHAKDSSTLFDAVLSDLEDGDILLIKGSLGSKMVPVADAFIALSDAASQDKTPIKTPTGAMNLKPKEVHSHVV